MNPVVTEFLGQSVTPWASDFVSDSCQTFKKYDKSGAPEPATVKAARADTSKMALWDKLIYPHHGKVKYMDFRANCAGLA